MVKKLFTVETAKEYGRRGGRARTKAQNLARAMNGLAKSDSPVAQLLRIAKTTDPQEAYEYLMHYYALQEELIQAEKNNVRRFYMNDRYIQRLLDFHKIKFGNKNFNLNANVGTVNLDVLKQRLKEGWDSIVLDKEFMEEVGKTEVMKKYNKDLK